jgi:hypothetical protein
MERRKFFQTLIAGGATVRKTRKRVPRAHSGDIRLYHGPMQVPTHVYEAVREDPSPMRASGRGTHLVSRYADPDGTVWLFRCQIPAHRGMVGEIVQAPIGRGSVSTAGARLLRVSTETQKKSRPEARPREHPQAETP